MRPDGRVFYVGKGSGDRINQHEREAERGCACHKCNIIRKVWRSGGEIQKEIVFRTSDEREALDYEIELIRHYGRENLANLTDGGDGASGRVMSEEGRRRIGEATRNRKDSLLTRLKKSIASAARRHTDETREKIRQSHIGLRPSDETRGTVGAASRARGISPQALDRAREVNTGKKHRPETIERMRERAQNRDAEWEANRRAGQRAYNEQQRSDDPAYRLMFALLRDGVHPNEIAARTGITVRTVYRWKKELGL